MKNQSKNFIFNIKIGVLTLSVLIKRLSEEKKVMLSGKEQCITINQGQIRSDNQSWILSMLKKKLKEGKNRIIVL